MKHLGLVGAVLPLVLLAVGMIGWVLTVRNDVTDAVRQITAVQEEISAINARMENERTIRTDLHTDQAGDLVTITNALSDRLGGLETDLVLANDQMATIMGDHNGFADVLRELGEIGVLPTGERRDYGGYGNR
jgi:Flp pilus assembly protein TadG